MSPTLIVALVVGGLVAGVVLWWLLVRTEGVFLGRGVVIWLYDRYARRYDHIKQFDPLNEDLYLARPILDRMPHVAAPLVLDVASGTGRVPLALLEQPTFQGRIVALDLSRRMLAVAAEKLAAYNSASARVHLLHYPAETLPFPDHTFDCVTCLEALEFMPDPRAVMDELVRVLRPGGLLVITNRQGLDARMMVGHTYRHAELERILSEEMGLVRVQVQVWQMDYAIVWAWKAGYSDPTGPRPLEEVWQCPRCDAVAMLPAVPDAKDGWRCGTCGTFVPLGSDGVIGAHAQRRS